MATWDPRANDLFLKALELHSAGKRQKYLDGACADDTALRAEVESLLEANSRAGNFLEEPAVGLAAEKFAETRAGATIGVPFGEVLGTMIGPYKLLQQIGEGGMGTVFMAEQMRPVQRKVALKVIKPGMDTKQVIARFEAERQALAMMDHASIARVLDAGTTPPSQGGAWGGGLPYFVMELVHGVPITEYCDDNHLTPRERLELFVPVCQAIQHAHQKGIIHRDIKPSNVMITLYDGKPVPKVIDFGVAKATEQKLTERTLFTQYGTMVGTLEYISPEQAEMSALGVDTRGDIYSLGVLLYELLTGSTPLSHKRLKEAAYGEVLRMIKEEEPQKPSTRLSASGEALVSISAHRHMEPDKLTKLMRGELDWIVMKTLEKDRNRRYETAKDFADDVQRYLADEPVQACPPSAGYRFRKFARRNKRILASVGLVALALVAGTVVSAWQAIRATDAFKQAKINYDLADDRAKEIQRGLEGLKAANALLDRGRWRVNEWHWDDAHVAITKAVQLRPDHVSVWVERGDLYTRLGLWDLAAADYAREMELREPDTTGRWYQHALLRFHVGDTDGYRQACQAMHKRYHGTLQATFAIELMRTCVLAPDRHADLTQLVELAQNVVASNPGSRWYLYVLGIAHYRAGQHEQAVRRLRESLAEDPTWDARALNYPVLAMAHHHLGEAVEARKALDEAARAIDQWTRDRYQSPGGPSVTHLMTPAFWPLAWWDWLECQLYYREARALIDGSPPPDDPRLGVLRARSLNGLRWHAEADIEYTAALKLRPDDAEVRLETHRNRGYRYVQLGMWRQAAAEFAAASELQPDDACLWHFRAVAHLKAGEARAYEQVCAAMVERSETTEDQKAAYYVVYSCVLKDGVIHDMGRLVPPARVAASYYYARPRVLGAALYRAGEYVESVRCFERAAEMYPPRAGDWCFLAMAHHRLGQADQARRCLAEAARWIDEANRADLVDLTRTKPNWGEWHEPVVTQLLLREAEELLGVNEKKN